VETSSEAAAIVRAVVGLARGFNLPVLAEGVETEGELNFLRDEACNSIQGYLLARPGPISIFAQHTRAKDAASPEMRKRKLRVVERGAAQLRACRVRPEDTDRHPPAVVGSRRFSFRESSWSARAITVRRCIAGTSDRR
jgi:EAL domain